MATEDIQQLAAKLGRPAGSLSGLSRLTPEQLGMLSSAIDRACAQQRETLDNSFNKAVPWPLRGFVLRMLRGKDDSAHPHSNPPPQAGEGDES